MTTILSKAQRVQMEEKQWRICARMKLGRPELANVTPPLWFRSAWKRLNHPDPDIRHEASCLVGLAR